jgi:hypothetical protein
MAFDRGRRGRTPLYLVGREIPYSPGPRGRLRWQHGRGYIHGISLGMDRGMDEPLPVAEAARALGISRDALYKRIRRNSVDWEKGEDGRIYVHVDTAADAAMDDGMDAAMYASTDQSALVASLEEQVAYLREVVRSRDAEIRRREEEYREESRRKDHLLAAALERIPAIEAPADPTPETRDAPETPFEKAAKGDPPASGDSEQPRGSSEAREPWWRRWFVG